MSNHPVPAKSASRAPLFASGIWLIVLIVAALFSVGAALALGEFSPRMIEGWTTIWVMYGALAVVGTLLLSVGGIDLSIGAVVGWVGVTIGLLAPEIGVVAAAAVAVFGAFVVGLVNGLLIGLTRLHPALITLGTLTLLRGIAFILTDSAPVRIEDMEILGSPVWGWGGLLLALAGTILLTLALMRSRPNLKQEDAGSGPLTRIAWMTALFAFSGLIAGLVGVAMAGRLGVGMAMTGTGFEALVLMLALLSGVPVGKGANGQTLIGLAAALVTTLAYVAVEHTLRFSDLPQASLEAGKGLLILVVALISFAVHSTVGRMGKPAAAPGN